MVHIHRSARICALSWVCVSGTQTDLATTALVTTTEDRKWWTAIPDKVKAFLIWKKGEWEDTYWVVSSLYHTLFIDNVTWTFSHIIIHSLQICTIIYHTTIPQVLDN